jgi:GT2 family glycosyltransferase
LKKLGAILVHYHTPGLLAAAAEALAADAAAAGLSLELVVVDNGSTAAEQETLSAFKEGRGIRVAEPGRNLGYAGGVNLGATLLPDCDVLLPMNPDVLVLPGCLAALSARIDAGAAAAGPAFYWDREHGFQLPPTEAVGFAEELLRVLAGRFGGLCARLARKRWRRHARRHFAAEQPLPAYDLSGAMMMVDAAAFRRLGGFDEGFALYFEETDFLQRLRRAGLRAEFEPRARAIHLYAQSTPRDGRAAALYAASQQRFREIFYGPLAARLLRRLSRGARPAPPPAARSLAPAAAFEPGASARWLELSPSPLLFPAAARRLAPGEKLAPLLSPELYQRMAPGSYWLSTLDEHGGELALARCERLEPPPPAAGQIRSPSPMV